MLVFFVVKKFRRATEGHPSQQKKIRGECTHRPRYKVGVSRHS